MTLARAAVDPIINAVLYEGYVLYPYRASSCKNRQRWSFGGLYPKRCGLGSRVAEPSRMQVQCLLEGAANACLEIEAGFLQPVDRHVEAYEDGRSRKVDALQVGEHRYTAWQEATERRVAVPAQRLREIEEASVTVPFVFEGGSAREPLGEPGRAPVGELVRTQVTLRGTVEVSITAVAAGLHRVSVIIENLSGSELPADALPQMWGAHVFGSTHAVLSVDGGAFVSLMDPPDARAEHAAACRNVGCYPVLVGGPGDRSTMLASPIILYDYPRIAPESPGDFFDGTEIDEMLSLRILTMTDAEKREMAALDPRARALLERTEQRGYEALASLHGTWRAPGADSPRSLEPSPRGPQLAFLRIGGRELGVGDRVLLKPRGSADLMDIVLAGKAATIAAIERDFEDRVHVAVTIDDDPGRDLGAERMPGHRFFYAPEELEPLGES